MEDRENLYDKTPFYMTYPIQNLYLAEMEYERDMERMRELYPREVQQILRLVQQRCDELEQEGSRMYDENPDRYMMEQEACRLFERFLQENPQYGNLMPMPQPGMPMPQPGMPMPQPGMPMPQPGMPMPQPGMPMPPPRPNRFPIMPPEEYRDMMPMPVQPRNPEMGATEIEAQNRRGERERRDNRGCGDSWLCSLIGVMFNDEVYRRRCRNRRCRRWSM